MECQCKEVYFDHYCISCVHVDNLSDDEPCDECLAYPVRETSHEPRYWEEKGK